jgi:hypothetical protein
VETFTEIGLASEPDALGKLMWNPRSVAWVSGGLSSPHPFAVAHAHSQAASNRLAPMVSISFLTLTLSAA